MTEHGVAELIAYILNPPAVSLTHRFALLATLAASPALSQDTPHQGLAQGDRFLETSVGYSWFSPRGGGWGLITDRRVYLTGVRAEWVLEDKGRLAWAFTSEFVPVAVVERKHPEETILCYETAQGRVCERDRSTRVAVGAGASPVGLKAYLNHSRALRFFASAAGGGLAFSSEVPVYRSRRLNFVFEYGVGAEFERRNGHGIALGYKFHHISNGATGDVNPGLDANVLYVGYRLRRTPRAHGDR